jgi:hypothetical protein
LAASANGASFRIGEAGISTPLCEMLGIIILYLFVFEWQR